MVMPTATKERRIAPAHPIEHRFPIATILPDSKVRAYRKRVQRGAEDLDERQPGWWRHIRLTRLDMGNGGFDLTPRTDCGCIGAQLACAYAPEYDVFRKGFVGVFQNWMNRIGLLSDRRQVSYGYVLSNADWYSFDEDAAWELLDQLWANEVRKRREA